MSDANETLGKVGKRNRSLKASNMFVAFSDGLASSSNLGFLRSAQSP